MRTRNGGIYPKPSMAIAPKDTESGTPLSHNKEKKRKSERVSFDFDSSFRSAVRRRMLGIRENDETMEQSRNKMATNEAEKDERTRNQNPNLEGFDYFNELPDDLILSILCKLSGSALSPADLFNARLTCKRFNKLGQDSWVLASASVGSLSVRATKWSEPAHQFLKRCCDAGSIEACYILGMIRFYCLENRGGGTALMAKAAMASHPSALYSLAIIQFNGSGGSKYDKDLRAGVTLCARAAHLGHVDALRELGHCLQDGYGIRRNVNEGRKFIAQANTREVASVVSFYRYVPFLKDVSCNGGYVPVLEPPHAANRFMIEWFRAREGNGSAWEEEGLRLCSYVLCGRVETRRHEFRRCSVCGRVNYCSRTCQALDWRRAHKSDCAPPPFVWAPPHAGDNNYPWEGLGEAAG